jgi:cell division protein FtsN
MARDYKHAGTRRRGGKGSGFNGWTGLALGLTLGIALAAGVHLYHTQPAPPEDDTAVVERPAQPEAANGDAAQRPRPRFDFYRMLPNYEVVIPEEDIAVATTPEREQVASRGTYVLQAGSFRSAGDADRLRAQLAMLGVESRVQTVTIDDADTWHRVRIGPISDLAELNATRQRLARNRIEALVIRVGD